MEYKAVNNSPYLAHFNPNHDPKNGRFTSSKFLNSDGSLSSYTRKNYGIDMIRNGKDSRDLSYKKAQKMIKKDLRKLFWSGSRYLESDVQEELAELKMEADIDKANKDAKLIADVKSGVKKYFEIEEKDGWDAAFDYQDKLISDLQKKYPQHKDLLYGLSPGENIWSGNVDKWLKSKEPFPDILNNDFYYEPSDLNKESLEFVDKVQKQYNKELTNAFIQKYGEQNMPSDWMKYV